ncbi:MAG: hypothetical protein ACC645_07350 [Pirellulales bacterium]
MFKRKPKAKTAKEPREPKAKKGKASRKSKVKRKKKPRKSKTAPSRGVYVARAPSDIFTALLALSLLALCVGCLLLWVEIARYGGLGAIKGPT